MRSEKNAPVARNTGARAAVRPANQMCPYSTRPRPHCQIATGDSLADLAALARARADRAAVLANFCAAAGDRAGFELWRRRLLAHQAIYYSAIHKTQEAAHD